MIKDLTLIILGIVFSYAYFYWQDYKRKKEQDRLNQALSNINHERNKRHD